MKVFFAQLNDNSSIKREASRMELVDDSIRVYLNGEIIAYLDTGTVLWAQIYEMPDKK